MTDGATRTIADLPGPPGLPLLGNAHQVRIDRLPAAVEEWCESYGPIFRFDLGTRRIVGVADVQEINRILRDRPDGFRRWREMKKIIAEMGGDSVFSAEGDDWRRQRRLAVTALNSNHLQRYFHVVHTCTKRLHSRLRKAAQERGELDITRELSSYTVDVTSALAFGHDLNTLGSGKDDLQSHIERVLEMTGRRIVSPIPYWRWVRLPADRALDRSLAQIRSALHGFIAEARARMIALPQLHDAPENFLEGMLAAQQTDGTFTDEELIANTFTLLNAGEDTTSHTLAWTLWFLASRPAMQESLAAEAVEILGEHSFPEKYETVESLHYCEAVLRESMRLKPVAFSSPVEPLADTTIAGVQIPAGTRLWLLTRLAGLRASTVERTSEFIPERWLDGNLATPDQKSFLAFGAGPRFCPGRNLAFLEAKSALAMIARNFEVNLEESGGPVTERFGFTMMPDGLRVRLRERVLSPT
ncbi:MAG TPA: cytochrome P450 [Solirubrobacteraceae bacterium]